MNPLKRIAIGLAVVLLLAAAAAAVFVASFDANRYKPLAIDWMHNEKQRTLAIDGPIELSLLPRLAIKLSKLRLSERGRPADEFAAVDEASLSLQLWPLLSKQLVVDRVQARGVRAVLTRDAQGRRNIDDLLAAPSSAAPSQAAPAGSQALRFDIGGVQLDDAKLTLHDAMAPLDGTLVLQSFRSGRLAPGVTSPVTLKAALALAKPQAVQLALDGRTELSFDPQRGSASLKSAQLHVSGDTAAVKAIDATLEGALAWADGTLQAGPLQVAVKGAQAGGVALAASRLEVKRLLFGAQTQKLELEALKLALAGRRGADPFELALDWPRLAVAGDKLQGSGFSGRFKLAGGNALAGRFESGAPTGSFDALRLPGFALKLDGSAGTRKLDADLKSDLLLRPGKGAASLDKLALRAKVEDAGLPPLQLAVDGNAGIEGQAARWTLQGALNTNRFDSSGSATLGGAVPNVQASARFDRLDLNRLTTPGQAAPAPAAPADTPIKLDGLNAVNGRFNLAAGELVFRQYQVADAKLDATLDGGTLRIQRLSGRAWGGAVEGSGSAEAKSQRIGIKLAASGVNVNALLKDVAGKDLLEGSGRVSADLTTNGASLGALRSNLAGSAALQLRDGAIKGVNLARSLRQAKAALSMKQDAVTQARAAEKTDFSELSATARIAGGVAESNDLDVKSPFLRIGGAGKFDIGRGRIDYTARATVIGAPVGQDGAELAALKGVTVPVQLSGPFEAIDWKIQWSGVAAAAVESKLKDKLAEKLGAKLGAPPAAGATASAPDKPKDQLKEKLKGLFGR